MSADARRTSHLKRIVPAHGCCTPIVAVNSGQTRANASRICLRVGCSMPLFRRVRRRYGSIRSQHHAAITTPECTIDAVKNFEIARLFYEMASLLEVENESAF